jgi:hypothetical protein
VVVHANNDLDLMWCVFAPHHIPKYPCSSGVWTLARVIRTQCHDRDEHNAVQN